MKTFGFQILILVIFLACKPTHSQIDKANGLSSSIDSIVAKRQSNDIHGNPEISSINILFIGNSLTYSNNLPKLVYEYAKTKKKEISTKMIAKPNYAIVDHLDNGNEVKNEINSKTYDFVVVQQGPSSQTEGKELLFKAGKRLTELCNTNDAKLVFFMVWPSRVYYHTFDGVIKNHTEASQAYQAILSPVGQKWKKYFDDTNDFSYYGPDQFHPSLKGSTVAAKIIFESILKSFRVKKVVDEK